MTRLENAPHIVGMIVQHMSEFGFAPARAEVHTYVHVPYVLPRLIQHPSNDFPPPRTIPPSNNSPVNGVNEELFPGGN